MTPFPRAFLATAMSTFLGIAPVMGGSSGQSWFRPPAVPLVTCDPYFSIWSFTDHPADDWTKHWTGSTMGMCGMAGIDGKAYRILGRGIPSLPKMTMIGLRVLPTQTIYTFRDGGVELSMAFTTPMLPHDLAVFSRPVTYLTFGARSVDGKRHRVRIYFDVSGEVAVNSPDQQVVWSRERVGDMQVMSIASKDQQVLNRSGDDLRIDWGHFYLAVPPGRGSSTVLCPDAAARRAFARGEALPGSDDLRMPRRADDDWPVLAGALDAGEVGEAGVERHLLLAYDDGFSIEYLYRRLRPFWRGTGWEADSLLLRAEEDYTTLLRECKAFDAGLMRDLMDAGGEEYAQLAALAYRQAFAAQKLAVDVDGTPMLFPKENFSNGCISTVDVIYPASPILLLLNVRLMKATLTPVLEYARTGRWHFPFAPHDLGTYPLADGQVYGGGEKTEENQMPVEETGNILILMEAIAHVEGNASFAERYRDLMARWAEYLREKGLDPENQLCTDDFAGHLAHNVNLSLKAIIALGAYGKLCEALGKPEEAATYLRIAHEYAGRWEAMAREGNHYRLAFDRPGTWSQKYNLVWDRILGLNLFPRDVAAMEVRYYKSVQNPFGVPLDNRAAYTKLDWTVWSASLAEAKSDFEALVQPLYRFANESTSRVPLTDWFDTKTGKQVGFQARSVVGGVFIRLLEEESVWKKYAARAAQGN